MDAKTISTIIGFTMTVGGMIWYAAIKADTIEQQEKHLEFQDARINVMDTKIRELEIAVIRLQDKP